MIQVYIATNLVDAEMAAEALNAAGVSAVVQGEAVAIPTGPFPTVWVEEENLERAREILASRETEADWVDPG
jgi:hypothetical protein